MGFGASVLMPGDEVEQVMRNGSDGPVFNEGDVLPRSGITVSTTAVLHALIRERARQIARWGDQSDLPDADPLLLDRVGRAAELGSYAYPDVVAQRLAMQYEVPTEARAKQLLTAEVNESGGTWFGILLEEVAEALAAIPHALAEGDPATVIAEVEQVATVAVAWSEALRRRGLKVTPQRETIRARALWDRLAEMTNEQRWAWLDRREILVGAGAWMAYDEAKVERRPDSPLILWLDGTDGEGEVRILMDDSISIRPRRG